MKVGTTDHLVLVLLSGTKSSVVDVKNVESSSSSVGNPRKEVECVCVCFVKEYPNVLSVLVSCSRFHLTYIFHANGITYMHSVQKRWRRCLGMFE